MAAAEYFSSAPLTTSTPPSYHSPTSQPQIPTSNPYQSQPQQRPPPYQGPNVHFAAKPVEIPQRHSFSHQQRPHQDSWSGPMSHQNSSPYSSSPQQPAYYSNGGTPNDYGTPPQNYQYLSPHMRPHANPNSSQYSLSQGGYSSDPEPSRRRRKHRTRRDSGSTRDGDSRSGKSESRSTNKDAFLGAAGGGLIGDLIFPGLGTVGGAAIGWFGGKDYGKHRKGREDKLEKDQVRWEKKHRPDQFRDRERDRDRDFRRGSS